MLVLEFMLLPFLTCLVLIGIHAYFGIHVLQREIIFVDLALAQIAALGGMCAVFFHRNPNSPLGYLLSLVTTFLGAWILAYTRHRKQKVPQEAYIGIVYAVASAAGILISDKAPEGAEHVKEMLAGVILWVTGKTILLDAIIYAMVGLLHVFLFRRFWKISTDYEGAREAGIRVRLWDFIFYASFGIVVTLSVRVAGVLLVFCFLVIPSVISALFWEGFLARLTAAYIIGTLVTLLGLTASWVYDLPSGPTVAVAFGLILVAAHLLLRIFAPDYQWSPSRRRMAGLVSGVVYIIIFAFIVSQVPAQHGPTHQQSTVETHSDGTRVSPDEPPETLESLVHHLMEAPPYEKESLLNRILQQYPHPPQNLPRELQSADPDPVNRYYQGRILDAWGFKEGWKRLCELIADTDLATVQARQKAGEYLQSKGLTQLKDYDPLMITDEEARRLYQSCIDHMNTSRSP